MSKQKIGAIILSCVVIILAIVSYFILPDLVVTQFSLGGGVTLTNKLLAILIPSLITISFSLGVIFGKSNQKTENKYLLVSVLGIVLLVILLVVNH